MRVDDIAALAKALPGPFIADALWRHIHRQQPSKHLTAQISRGWHYKIDTPAPCAYGSYSPSTRKDAPTAITAATAISICFDF